MTPTTDRAEVPVGQLLAEVVRRTDRARRTCLQAVAAVLTLAVALAFALGAPWSCWAGLLGGAGILLVGSFLAPGSHHAVEHSVEVTYGNLEQLRLLDSPRLDDARVDLSARMERAGRVASRWGAVRAAGLGFAVVVGFVLAKAEYDRRLVLRPGYYPISEPLAAYEGYLNDPETQPRAVANLAPMVLQPAVAADRAIKEAARSAPSQVADLIAGVEGKLPTKANQALNQMEQQHQAAKDALAAVANGPFPPELQAQAREQSRELDQLLLAAKVYKLDPTQGTKSGLNKQTESFLSKVADFLKKIGAFIKALLELLNLIIGGGANGTGVSANGAAQVSGATHKAVSGQSITPADATAAEKAMRGGYEQVGPSTFAAPFDPSAATTATGSASADGLLKPLDLPTQARKATADRGSEKTPERLNQKAGQGGHIAP